MNNRIVLMALGALLINGCVVKEKFVSNSTFMKKDSKQKLSDKKKFSWKKFKTSSNKTCVDCYALPVDGNEMRMAKLNKNEVFSYDYSNAPVDTFNNTIDYSVPAISRIESVRPNPYANDEQYYVTKPISYINNSNGDYATTVAVQVGAFRRYEGAKVYTEKYNHLPQQFHVKIETAMEGNKPLHRVKIEGFKTRGEAQKFISRYDIYDAFLVSR